MNKKISFPIAITIIVACAVLTSLIVWQCGFIPGIGPSGSLPRPSAKEVTITTDKTEYEQGGTIEITLKNNLKESIFSHIGSGTPVFCIEYIERKTPAGVWEKLFAQCQYPHCMYEIDASAEIRSGQSVALEWEPLIFVNGTSETIQAGPGQYRLSILYEDYQKTEWRSIYSNEFTIK